MEHFISVCNHGNQWFYSVVMVLFCVRTPPPPPPPPPQTRYDVHHALVLAETHHFQAAVLYLYEHKLNM